MSKKLTRVSANNLAQVCFDINHMKRMISYGTPMMTKSGQFVGYDKKKDSLRMEFGLWMNSVPFELQPIAADAIYYVFCRNYQKLNFNDKNLNTMIHDMHEYIWKRLGSGQFKSI